MGVAIFVALERKIPDLEMMLGGKSLARHQAGLTHWVAAHPVAAALLYLSAYVLTAALSLPQAAIVTVAGGLLFGTVLGGVLTIIGATAGAAILVAVVQTALHGVLDRHRRRIPAAVQARLARDGFLYLLALRLLPVVPFWLVNLAAAVGEIRLPVFVPATLLGIAPASFVFSSVLAVFRCDICHLPRYRRGYSDSDFRSIAIAMG